MRKTKVASAVKGLVAAKQPDGTVTFYKVGERLAARQAESDIDLMGMWVEALSAVKTKEDRKALRAGFVDVYSNAMIHANGKSKTDARKSADNRFDYLANLYAPKATSRKAKSNKRKRKEKETSDGLSAAPADASLRMQIVNFIKHKMEQHVGAPLVLEVLGELRTLLDADNKAVRREAKAAKTAKAKAK
jgi:hypothetical protein